ncbi:MAG: hypothetical protein PHF84_10790 [bacterium]|nr:hypothetical protein [bacterium]
MKFNLRYKIIIILFLFCSCENKITAPERVIVPPVGIDVTGYDKGITVKFYGKNVEEGFKGYNVYISKTPGIDRTSLSPVPNAYNSTPTLMYGYGACYPDASEKSYITLYQTSVHGAISNHQLYYVAVSAYAVIGNGKYESPLSEEKGIIIQSVDSNTLYNNAISGKSNDGILFPGSGTGQVKNAPDTVTNNWGGDLFFKLRSLNGSILPVLSVESCGTGIQDMGYYPSLDDVSYVPAAGYITGDSILVQENHVYILYKNGTCIKIYIRDILGSATSLNSDVAVNMKFAY